MLSKFLSISYTVPSGALDFELCINLRLFATSSTAISAFTISAVDLSADFGGNLYKISFIAIDLFTSKSLPSICDLKSVAFRSVLTFNFYCFGLLVANIFCYHYCPLLHAILLT